MLPDALQPAKDWMAQVEELWLGQLQSFKAYAESVQRTRRIRT